MSENVLQAAVLEAMLAEAIRGMGLDPEKARREIAILAARLCGADEEIVDFATIRELTAKLPNHKQIDQGTLVFVGTVCVDGKWYRTEKWWATVDGKAVWDHPEVRKIREWRGAGVLELGYQYRDGAKKVYLAVYLVPPGKKVRFTGLWEDEYKGRRPYKGYEITS